MGTEDLHAIQAHMLSDVGGFIVSLVALQLSRMEATKEYTFGYKQAAVCSRYLSAVHPSQQAEVLGALLSVALVWALTAVLLSEALDGCACAGYSERSKCFALSLKALPRFFRRLSSSCWAAILTQCSPTSRPEPVDGKLMQLPQWASSRLEQLPIAVDSLTAGLQLSGLSLPRSAWL